jgi:hypothetical protein
MNSEPDGLESTEAMTSALDAPTFAVAFGVMFDTL